MAMCLMTAPLLWLAMRVVFDDGFAWSALTGWGLVFTLVLGATVAVGWGGLLGNVVHKLVLMGFVVATLWTVVKDWRSDLVTERRLLRTWVAAGLGTYVMLVLVFELVFVQGAAPRWLEVLNLVGIVVLSALVAVASARHTLDQWLGSRSTGVEPAPLPAGADAADTSVIDCNVCQLLMFLAILSMIFINLKESPILYDSALSLANVCAYCAHKFILL